MSPLSVAVALLRSSNANRECPSFGRAPRADFCAPSRGRIGWPVGSLRLRAPRPNAFAGGESLLRLGLAEGQPKDARFAWGRLDACAPTARRWWRYWRCTMRADCATPSD